MLGLGVCCSPVLTPLLMLSTSMLVARSSLSSCITSSSSYGTLSLFVLGNEKSGLQKPCSKGEMLKSSSSPFGVFVSAWAVMP
eukprot:7261289-Pyramimonas_sp.AAC.1